MLIGRDYNSHCPALRWRMMGRYRLGTRQQWPQKIALFGFPGKASGCLPCGKCVSSHSMIRHSSSCYTRPFTSWQRGINCLGSFFQLYGSIICLSRILSSCYTSAVIHRCVTKIPLDRSCKTNLSATSENN